MIGTIRMTISALVRDFISGTGALMP